MPALPSVHAFEQWRCHRAWRLKQLFLLNPGKFLAIPQYTNGQGVPTTVAAAGFFANSGKPGLLLVENFAGAARIVTAERGHGPAKFRAADNRQERGAARRLEEGPENQQVVLLFADGNEIQAQGLRRGAHAEPRVRTPARDGHAHGHVGELFALVARDRRRLDADLLQLAVEQAPRAGTRLAVDEADSGARQVFEPGERFGIAARHENSLLAPRQVNQCDRQPGNRPPDIGNIVNAALRIEQVGAGQVSLAAPEREQSAETADVGGGNLQLRMAPLQLVFEHADGEIVAAGAENRIFDVGEGPKQLDLSFLAGVEPFDQAGNAQQTIGPH